jgi:hypothetical protein
MTPTLCLHCQQAITYLGDAGGWVHSSSSAAVCASSTVATPAPPLSSPSRT